MKTLVAAIVVAVGMAGVVRAQDAKVAQGLKVYTDMKCSTCHQIAGKGNKMSVLDDVATKTSAADLKKWLTATAEMEAKLPKKPPVSMSGWMKTKKIADADVEALVAYLLTLKK